MSSLGQLASAIGQALGSLMSAASGGSGSSDTPTTPTTGTTGCTTSYYDTSDPSVPSEDPCAIYVPTTTLGTTSSSTDSSIQSLLDALNGTPGGSLNGSSGSVGSTDTSGTALNPDVTTASSTGSFNPFGNLPVATSTAGLSGSIELASTSATFVTNDIQGNVETASFFGGDTISGFVSNLVGSWCTSRPWASGFIASIIPPSFFDGLCTNGGFTVGAPQPAANGSAAGSDSGITETQATGYVSLTQTPVDQTQTQTQPATAVIQTASASTTPYIPGRVDIWAVPPSVPLGARTTIFWNTENVSNCTETSPDGSFSQTSLSGGAATVPLTEPTTYTISCLDSQQNPVTDYVTVDISD
jgi:hypothetical protein